MSGERGLIDAKWGEIYSRTGASHVEWFTYHEPSCWEPMQDAMSGTVALA